MMEYSEEETLEIKQRDKRIQRRTVRAGVGRWIGVKPRLSSLFTWDRIRFGRFSDQFSVEFEQWQHF